MGWVRRPEAAQDQAVVEGEDLQAAEAGRGQAGSPVVLDINIPRPGAVLSGRDHRKNGVARPIEGPAGEEEGGVPFFPLPFGERDRHHQVPAIKDHGSGVATLLKNQWVMSRPQTS